MPHAIPQLQGRVDKVVTSLSDALAGIESGASLLIGGFGEVGVPTRLIEGLVEAGLRDLTVIANNAGSGDDGIGLLFRHDMIRTIICSFPRSTGSVWFERRVRSGSVSVELVPQGTLSERIRAGGAGIPAFFTPTGVDTTLAKGKETRAFGGKTYVLEHSLRADVALIKAHRADRWGNLTYRATARNYAPTMAAAADLCIAEVSGVEPLGALSPEAIVTPCVYVDRVYSAERRDGR